MVENPTGCVLHWAGHAGYVTERFSGLLARQALVDVTLVCEEQKLRVHKLVLASNSMYFEEILQEDLGQEPIIFLKDLNFEILKAMIEFMYCGETTIAQHYLPSLFAAAKTFKVKELASVVNIVMSSKRSEELDHSINVEEDLCKSKVLNDSSNEKDCIELKSNNTNTNKSSLVSNSNTNNVDQPENQSLENNTTVHNADQEMEHELYEEDQNVTFNEECINAAPLISVSNNVQEDEQSAISSHCKVKKVPTSCPQSSVINNNVNGKDGELKPILYEQCCDFSDINECETTLSRSCHKNTDKSMAQYSCNDTDVPNNVGKCVKVYSHKRRKSVDEVKNKLVHMNNLIPDPPSTYCIDLLDEPSSNDIPVTLLTSLDMESAEYIISLSTENIQSIVGATVNEEALLKYKENNARANLKACNKNFDYNSQKENIAKSVFDTPKAENRNGTKPTLRRSMRLNQQESEDSTHADLSISQCGVTDKNLKKSISPHRTELYIKGKRKTKDTERKVPEQHDNNFIHRTKRNFNGARTHKNASKLIVKKNTKSASCVSKYRDDHKAKSNNKLKSDAPVKVEAPAPSTFTSVSLHTIEHINRALWGDMSDILERNEDTMDLSEYTPDTDIPFAVGLLPLRTALEKMQATPDYQPRKTRSSVAPMKQEVNGLKRKSCAALNTAVVSKKLNNNNNNNNNNESKENTSTVCHIQIRAAPSQYIRSRKKFASEGIVALSSAAITNSQ